MNTIPDTHNIEQAGPWGNTPAYFVEWLKKYQDCSVEDFFKSVINNPHDMMSFISLLISTKHVSSPQLKKEEIIMFLNNLQTESSNISFVSDVRAFLIDEINFGSSEYLIIDGLLHSIEHKDSAELYNKILQYTRTGEIPVCDGINLEHEIKGITTSAGIAISSAMVVYYAIKVLGLI